MKTLAIMAVPLSQGLFALVDGEDYKWLMQWKWYTCKEQSGNYYARRTTRKYKRRQSILMHRQVLNTPKGMETDHRNHCGLDNRKQNVRVCTKSQNNQNNRKAKAKKSSRYKGVSWSKRRRKWRAVIQLDKKQFEIGSFNNEIEAAKAYDAKAKELFGEFANLNFKEQEDAYQRTA